MSAEVYIKSKERNMRMKLLCVEHETSSFFARIEYQLAHDDSLHSCHLAG